MTLIDWLVAGVIVAEAVYIWRRPQPYSRRDAEFHLGMGAALLIWYWLR